MGFFIKNLRLLGSIRKRALNILKFYKKQHETIKKYNKYLPDTILGIKSAQRVLYTKKPQ